MFRGSLRKSLRNMGLATGCPGTLAVLFMKRGIGEGTPIPLGLWAKAMIVIGGIPFGTARQPPPPSFYV